MKRFFKKSLMSILALLSIIHQANAGLISNADNTLIYDDVSKVTWLADISHIKRSGYDDDGKITLAESITWADELEVFSHDDWRLPTLSEGIGLQQSKSDWGLFSNILLGNDHIWSSTSKITDSGVKSYFFTFDGNSKIILPKTSKRYAWAVFDGKFSDDNNVDATISEPTSIALLSLALAGIALRREQQKTANTI